MVRTLNLLWFIFKKSIYLFIYSWQTQREREAETQAEGDGEAGSMQGAWHGTRSWIPRIIPWAEDGTKPLGHRGCPLFVCLFVCFVLFNKWLPAMVLYFHHKSLMVHFTTDKCWITQRWGSMVSHLAIKTAYISWASTTHCQTPGRSCSYRATF